MIKFLMFGWLGVLFISLMVFSWLLAKQLIIGKQFYLYVKTFLKYFGLMIVPTAILAVCMQLFHTETMTDICILVLFVFSLWSVFMFLVGKKNKVYLLWGLLPLLPSIPLFLIFYDIGHKK